MHAIIGFTGDLTSHFGFAVLQEEGQSYQDFFSPEIRALCDTHHEMWGNLEGPATRNENAIDTSFLLSSKRSRFPKLFFPKQFLTALRDLNFRVLGIANNHSFDFGSPDDIFESAAILRSMDVEAPGAYFEPVVREIDGVSFAIFATTCHVNGTMPSGSQIAFLSRSTLPELLAAVRIWKSRVDYIVVLTHWGQDYEPVPRESIRNLAKYLIDSGVNVIYGNHPHILWPIEQPGPRQLICYSLGNFSQVIGCVPHHPRAPVYNKALFSGLLTVNFSLDRIDTVFYPTETRHNFAGWLHSMGCHKSYWIWNFEDVAMWLQSLSVPRERLWSKVFRNGPPRRPPATEAEVQNLYPDELRDFMFELA